ncbi:MAG: amino acid adenylation domain-containing protein [Coriobacteriales bacterium]
MTNVLEWLEARARELPDKVAFADENGEIGFLDLMRRAHSVGSYLAGIVDERSPIACYMEKSTLALTAMFGAVYARCCYSIIDVRQPASRARAIVDKLAAPLVIADAKNFDAAWEAFDGYLVICLEDIVDTRADSGLLARRRAAALDTDPLYINFTSGSTGVPKGVAVSHRSVIDFIGSFVSIFDITKEDVLANQAPFDFDVSVKDIYGGLATGATVQMIPREYFSVPVNLMDFLVEREVTVCTWAVSAMCFVSMMGGFDYRVPTTIRAVIFSGEVMPPKQLAVWRAALPDAMFVNVYGPTEVTCNCTYHIIVRDYDKDETIPMGRPFPNERVFLLDEDDQLVDMPGDEGEICVTGTCLALGYYNDAEKTAESFVQSPLTTAFPETMYRTGDMATFDEAGRLVYRGRKDHQIKHLGQRIELGEIDAAAHGVDGVKRACTVYDARKKRILLFYVGPCEKDALADALKEILPQYMVPNKIRKLDAMPLNKNGKIDRQALLDM